MTGDSFFTALSFAPPEVVTVTRTMTTKEIARLRRAGTTGMIAGDSLYYRLLFAFRTRSFRTEQFERTGHVSATT